MTRADRLARYAAAYGELTTALAAFEGLPPDFWHFRPRPGAWSVHEIVLHLADSEANSYIRLRRLAAEPGSTVLGYDQDRWARELHYPEQSLDTALQTFRWLRQSSVELLRHLPESVWGHAVTHSEAGHYPFERWLELYAEHVPGHIAQMQRNLAAWRAAQQFSQAQR